MNFKVALLVVFILASGTVVSQGDRTRFLADSLDWYVKKGMDEWKIPGVAVLVVKDGEVVVSKGYGVREMGKRAKVDENTLFMIASNTKAFTGTALAMMEDEGRCSLEDPVKKWLPSFSMKDPWVEEHITLTDVLSHRTGMETFQGDFMYWNSDLSRDEAVEKFGKLTPVYDFRTTWGYCNAGFLVAGECLEQISGMTWEDFIRTRILKPLEMDRTLALTSELASADNVCAAHTLVEGELTVVPRAQIDNIAPAASISSSVNDLSHWVMALLDFGNYNGSQVIPSWAITLTRNPASIIRKARHPFNSSNYILYGLGWDLQDYEGRKIVSHTGGTDGFVTSVTLVPNEDLAVVVLTNTDMNRLYAALKWEVIDAFLGLPFRDYSGYYLRLDSSATANETALLASWRDSVAMKPLPPVKLEKFEGRYTHDIYGYADLKAEQDHLVMTLEHHPQLSARLEYMGENRFLCTYSIPLWGIKVFPFEISGGEVRSFTLSVSDFLEFTTYEFLKN